MGKTCGQVGHSTCSSQCYDLCTCQVLDIRFKVFFLKFKSHTPTGKDVARLSNLGGGGETEGGLKPWCSVSIMKSMFHLVWYNYY